MKPISYYDRHEFVGYYDGWNDAVEEIYQKLWCDHRELALEIVKLKVSWPRIEADERQREIRPRSHENPDPAAINAKA